jgi:hypothetical protein
MSKFTTPLRVELIGKNLWKVIEEFEYHVGSYPSEEIIKVPDGKITDFASVPRIFWIIISPVDRHAKAAVVHDYCYMVKYSTKSRCDEIFLEGLEVLGVAKWKRYVMYWAVKYFAWPAWISARIRDWLSKKLERYK